MAAPRAGYIRAACRTRHPPALAPGSRAGEYSARSSHRRGAWSWGTGSRDEAAGGRSPGWPPGQGSGSLAGGREPLRAAGCAAGERRLGAREPPHGSRLVAEVLPSVGADVPGLRLLAAVIMMPSRDEI